MKTKFEKDDVSSFRKFVREKRFNQPQYDEHIKALLSRLGNTEEPPIELVLAKSEQKDNSKPLDSVGVGKTDFTYYAASYYRNSDLKINALAFPDIFDQVGRGQNFYNSIFVPEVLRLTRKTSDRLMDFVYLLGTALKSFSARSLLLLRVNILLTVTLLAFIIGAVSIDDIFKHQSELIALVSQTATPIVLILLVVGWFFIVLDKIKKDESLLLEWKENSAHDLRRTLQIESTNIAPAELAKRLGKNTTIIILDDASQIDAQSLINLIELATLSKNTSQKSKTKIGLVLICDTTHDETLVDSDHRSVHELVSEFRCRRNNWLCFDLFPPSIEEVEWYLWGFYHDERPWSIVKQLIAAQPAIQVNSGFLMQFLYDETTVLENKKGSLKTADTNEVLRDYESFSAQYELHAERILSKIPNDSIASCKELLKYILAFDSPIKNIEIINMLMEDNGFPNTRHLVDLLSDSQLIKVINGDYVFVKPSERNTLLLNWSEWKENSATYFSQVFKKIHDYSSHRKLIDNPLLAKKCLSSDLIVDTLWREADALWFYGGNADIRTAIEYYGLETGALAKWYQLFSNDIKNENVSNENFSWHVKAKNSPYRYKTNRSVRSESFIGDLIQSAASLYFSAGEYDKSFYILNELWGEIRRTCWNSSEIADKIKSKIREADTKIQVQLSEYLITGPIAKKNWDLARNLIKTLGKENSSLEIGYLEETILWRLNYFQNYGAGNLPSSLSLIRQSKLEKLNKHKNVKSIISDLISSQINLSHIHDCIRFALRMNEGNIEISEPLETIKSTLLESEKNITLLKKQVEKSLQSPYPLIDSSFYPIADAEAQILIHKGLCYYYYGKAVFYEYLLKTRSSKSRFDIPELGKSIREGYELCQTIWNIYDPSKIDLSCYPDVLAAKKSVSDLYSKFLNSENPKRRELQEISQNINDALKKFVREFEKNYFSEALRLLKLASDLSSIRLQRYDETQADYYQTMILIELIIIDQQLEVKNYYLEWFADLTRRVEVGSKYYICGYAIDSLRYHIRIAEVIGERGFESAYLQYEIGRTICDRLGDCLPSIVKGQIVSHQLNLVGNMGAFVPPDQIFSLANQALGILNTYVGEGITKDDLEYHKASIRWWIAEACARLATTDSENLNQYFETARQNINWIDRQSKDNPTIKRVYIPKIKQVQSQFYSMQGDNKQAVVALREALDEFDDNLSEQIQTLEMIVSVGWQDLHRNHHNKDKKEIESYWGNLLNFRTKLMRARNTIEQEHRQDMLYYKTAEGAVTFAHTVLFTNIREDSELANSALDLWLFGIKGFLAWGLAGRATIQLKALKALSSETMSIQIPVEFNDLVRQCVTSWDPRRELTDKLEVEKALSVLVGKNINIQDILTPASSGDKITAINQAQILLSRPTPDTDNAYLILRNMLEVVDINNPVSEDVDLVRLLIACSKKENFESAKEYNQLFANLTDSLASKVYLEIADAFSDSPEIRDRYLHMAAIINSNKFSDEANREIFQTLNKEGIRKPDLTKDNLEKTNYVRLIELAVEEYDITEAYNLLFLFENELRRLIAYQFNQRNGWWKKGIPSDIYERVARENGEHIKGVELLNSITLGDLFRIVLFGDNWDQIFSAIFLSPKLVEARQSLILSVRNRIAHTDRNLSMDSIREYVGTTKNMIKQIQPHLPK